MPPRIPSSHRSPRLPICTNVNTPTPRRWASSAAAAAAVASTPAASIPSSISPPIHRYPPSQPPSHKHPDLRKTQLHRTYQSLLRSTPLLLLFQHNNLKAAELVGIRRELAFALRKADELEGTTIGEWTKLQVIQTSIFASALHVVEFYDPTKPPPTETYVQWRTRRTFDPSLTHGLSTTAWVAQRHARKRLGQVSPLQPLLSGPLMLLTFPAVSPAHLKAALQILSPSEKFPAPKRRVSPNLYEPAVQSGLQKLLLLAARAEGRVFDGEGTRWLGGIEGGLVGLRSQLVGLLQGFGVQLAGTLEAASKSLYFTLETQRSVLEEGEKPKEEGQAKSEEGT